MVADHERALGFQTVGGADAQQPPEYFQGQAEPQGVAQAGVVPAALQEEPHAQGLVDLG